ncbi:MAG: glycogen synthase GlgA [Verrucomicrobiota bacterium]|nr:glycogen synthase GlgA [Verrucomicrobiota bacterium]
MQVSGECFPYSKTGGLADMVGALSKALAVRGTQVQVVTPLYRGIARKFKEIQPMDWALDLEMGDKVVSGKLYTLNPQPNLTIYFIEQPDYFDRPGIYGEKSQDYEDNSERFLFFSKAATNLARYLTDAPDIVHAHDWQAGMVPAMIQHQHMRGGWYPAPTTCFTIHNLAYQGNFPSDSFSYTNLPSDYFGPHGVEFYKQVSFLKSGLIFADQLTTVSPKYAKEILTEEFACGMGGVLNARAESLCGILNGVDYEDWNTLQNPNLDATYTVGKMDGKALQKKNLQTMLGLPCEPNVPLLGLVGRLVDQKGMDLLLPALHATLDRRFQFVLLGSGMPFYQEGFKRLARDYPDQVAVTIGYDNSLAHKIEAASDFFVMPSKFEPCGLNQLYSLKYGSVPIVRAVGGLDDSIIGLSESANVATGIKFNDYAVTALEAALNEAFDLFEDQESYKKIRKNGMLKDFSWERTSLEYLDLYYSLLQ